MARLDEVLLQDSFTVWDPKVLLKKKKEYHIFLFDICLIFARPMKDSNSKNKYQFKFQMNVSPALVYLELDCESTVIWC